MKTIGNVYAVIDTVADMIFGPLLLQKHDAAAIRLFSDIAAMKDGIIGQHPQDFELIKLGSIEDDFQITPEKRVVITGKQWQATQTTSDHA